MLVAASVAEHAETFPADLVRMAARVLGTRECVESPTCALWA